MGENWQRLTELSNCAWAQAGVNIQIVIERGILRTGR
jgi:hypothetical protein